jgi:hypothetical protein
MSNKVVARFKDGRILKGASLDVDPGRPSCHLRTLDGKMVEVQLRDLKALFFVRSLEGDAARDENRTPDPGDARSRGLTLCRLRFGDGEEMVGLTIRCPPSRPFFFVLPVDPQSNNVRMLVNRDAVVAIEPIAQA